MHCSAFVCLVCARSYTSTCSDVIPVPLKLVHVMRELHLVLIALSCFQAFKKSKEVMQRFIRAYQLMLRFYGIVLINKETGELKRAENWAERFQNLNR